jgi:adenosylhomocysteine nucleosidase
MTIVVLVSADAEWAAVKEYSSPECVEPTPYGECFTRAVGNEEVLFFHGGWGKIAAAAATEYAINRWRPDVLINIGTCGGIEGRVERGEKLLVTRAITYDVQEAMDARQRASRPWRS